MVSACVQRLFPGRLIVNWWTFKQGICMRTYNWLQGLGRTKRKEKNILSLLPALGHQNFRLPSLGTLGLSPRPQGFRLVPNITPMTSLVFRLWIQTELCYLHPQDPSFRQPVTRQSSQPPESHEPILLMNFFLYVNFYVYVIGSVPQKALTRTVVHMGARSQLRL